MCGQETDESARRVAPPSGGRAVRGGDPCAAEVQAWGICSRCSAAPACLRHRRVRAPVEHGGQEGRAAVYSPFRHPKAVCLHLHLHGARHTATA